MIGGLKTWLKGNNNRYRVMLRQNLSLTKKINKVIYHATN
jgi:hypothetical protein